MSTETAHGRRARSAQERARSHGTELHVATGLPLE